MSRHRGELRGTAGGAPVVGEFRLELCNSLSRGLDLLVGIRRIDQPGFQRFDQIDLLPIPRPDIVQLVMRIDQVLFQVSDPVLQLGDLIRIGLRSGHLNWFGFGRTGKRDGRRHTLELRLELGDLAFLFRHGRLQLIDALLGVRVMREIFDVHLSL